MFVMMEVQDVVHGVISIPPDIACIIETAQFQRLKHIKQLGFLPLLLPDANYTRFDHSIGTYYLTRKMLDCLVKNSANIRIPEVYRKCIEVAALLHDIGHGAFSHTWEQVCHGFNHEENALPCVDAIFADLTHACLQILRDNDNFGIELIKALILGDPLKLLNPIPKEHRFIFEIVNNKQCKIDIDKLDYLKRDHHYLKSLCSPDMRFDDIFLEARVAADGAHIEYRYKDYDKIYTLFAARWQFHVYCYRLIKVLACEKIFNTIINRSQATICSKKLTEINAFDMSAFLQLTDNKVLELIKDDEAFIYLSDLQKIEQVNNNYYVKENISYSMIVIENIVRGPGEEMPTDDELFLYGNKCDKNRINRNMAATKIIGYFLLR